MNRFLVVFTTFDRKEFAERIAEKLLTKKLAACVQMTPIESIYSWKGRIEKAEEYLCTIKTREELYGDVEEIIKENHSYEVPEIVAVPIVKGSDDYLSWLNENTT